MHILGIDQLNKAIKRFAQDQEAFAWHSDVKSASWKNYHEVKASYSSFSPLGKDCYCFNIKGNTYRIEVIIHFQSQLVLIKRIGTHAEYDKWNKKR